MEEYYIKCLNEEVDEIRFLYKKFAINLNVSENILDRKFAKEIHIKFI
ncbi:TPA: hypothetical protein KNN40_002934 [Clostridioides difficile]|nr:hypothetical protein [Clostridioides difficile]MCP8337833.1 hypothetical protein [Clostridioides difficile]MCP8383265.1 hypothetical protein [Clostridioides difficile]HBE9294007.1 hypothetical protein [Clostridioides difficile]HBF0434003.1 hypothetical protein [Clostridioides difficile]